MGAPVVAQDFLYTLLHLPQSTKMGSRARTARRVLKLGENGDINFDVEMVTTFLTKF